ncbi:MAG: AAA family ATPase, partial [Clostridiales bacterium]|nr:AAA family ATPase [Clostridiales bacterium]
MVTDERYSTYFGLTEPETESLLTEYGLPLNNKVKEKYNGYVFGGTRIYNPWSVVSYASKKELAGYWVNTSTNALIRESLRFAG